MKSYLITVLKDTSNLKKFVFVSGTLFGVTKCKRFYDEYALKKEGIRRLKKHFINNEDFKYYGIKFGDYFHKNYIYPMM